MMKVMLWLLTGLKFSKVLLSGGSMLISLLVYSLVFGWKYAAGFVVLLVRRRMDPAASLLGAAIAMKAAPAVFLPLCHRVAGRRGVVVAVAAAGLLTIVSLLAFRSPITATVPKLLANLGTYAAVTSHSLEPANHTSGLYGLIILGDWTAQLTPAVRPVWQILKAGYPFIAAAILAVSMILSVRLPMRLACSPVMSLRLWCRALGHGCDSRCDGRCNGASLATATAWLRRLRISPTHSRCSGCPRPLNEQRLKWHVQDPNQKATTTALRVPVLLHPSRTQ
jgi:hypothetical protein